MEFTAKVRTCLWFDGRGEEAAEFYVSLLPDSFIETVAEVARTVDETHGTTLLVGLLGRQPLSA